MSEKKKPPLANRPEILLIEDDPQIRRFLRAMLTAEDYRLYESASGEDGLAQAAARTPNLVLLDLGLNEVWGPEHVEEREYLRVFMSQLRHKLESDPAHPRHLITEPGVGYRLIAEE